MINSETGAALTIQSKIPSSENHTVDDLESFDRDARRLLGSSPFEPSLKKQRYFGKSFVFCWHGKEPVFTIGPDWWLFVITWFGLEALGVAIYFIMLKAEVGSAKLITLALTIWEGVIYLLVALLNPGLVTSYYKDTIYKKDQQNINFCQKCLIFKEKTVRHCHQCDICVQGYDHHCPFTGKCIGKGNIWLFYAFIGSTAMYIFGLIFLTVQTNVLSNLEK